MDNTKLKVLPIKIKFNILTFNCLNDHNKVVDLE